MLRGIDTVGSHEDMSITERKDDIKHKASGADLSIVPMIEIRFSYNTVRNNYIRNDGGLYEYHELEKTEYQIDLLPTGEGLQFLTEIPREIYCQPDQRDEISIKNTGIITLITKNENHARASLIEAYLNGDK